MRLGRWVVLFFTRPIHVSDVSAFLRSLKRREKVAPVVVPVVAGSGNPQSPRPARPRARVPVPAARPRLVALRDPALEIGVSEQPFDTLPAELQSEFGVIGRGAPGPSRTATGGSQL